MIKKSLEKALHELDPEIVDEIANEICEKRLEMEATKVKTINFRKRVILIAAAAALVIAAVLIPLAVMMNKAPDPATQPPVATNSTESKTEKQTTPTDVQPSTQTNVDPTNQTDDPTAAEFSVPESADLMRRIYACNPNHVEIDEAFISAQFDFDIKLFKKIIENNKDRDVVVSPLSVMLALSMTANGASGQTLAEMEALLGGGMPISDLNAYIKSYIDQLPDSEQCRLIAANSIWINDVQRFCESEDFLQTVADYYGADAYKMLFDNEALGLLNAWVKDRTKGRIEKIFDEFSNDDLMVILNALTFDGRWENVFEESANMMFHGKNGEKAVDMMLKAEEMRVILDGCSLDEYFEEHGEPDAVGFMKNYAGGRYSFAAILPREGTDVCDYLETLTGEKLRALFESAGESKCLIGLPKFTSTFDTSLNGILKSLGMSTAFDHQTADFSGVGTSDAGNIAIGSVAHSAMIKVDRLGTVAAAATGISLTDEGAPINIYLNRPFIYMIVDNVTGLPAFMGVYAGE